MVGTLYYIDAVGQHPYIEFYLAIRVIELCSFYGYARHSNQHHFFIQEITSRNAQVYISLSGRVG